MNDLRQQLASSSRSVAKKDAKIVQLEANLQQATNANMKLNKEFNEVSLDQLKICILM